MIGLASVFIISAWSIQELRYDRFHHRSKEIYMLTTDIKDNAGNVNRFPETPAPLAEELALQIPRIDQALHFLYLYGGRDIGTEMNSFKESGLAATPAFFEVFNFSLLAGSASELDDPNSSLQFDFVIPYEIEYGISDEWWQLSDATFIRLSQDADPDRIFDLIQKVRRPEQK